MGNSESSWSVLLVDDDDFFRLTTGLALERYGYRVIYAKDGDEAVEQIQKNHPSVVVLDIFMPSRDGFEVLSWINDAAIHMPIIVISGGFRGRTELLPLSVPLGADKTLLKPFSCGELDQGIRALLEAPRR